MEGARAVGGLKNKKTKNPPLQVPPIIVKLFSVKYNSIVISKNPKMMYSYVTQIKFF